MTISGISLGQLVGYAVAIVTLGGFGGLLVLFEKENDRQDVDSVMLEAKISDLENDVNMTRQKCANLSGLIQGQHARDIEQNRAINELEKRLK